MAAQSEGVVLRDLACTVLGAIVRLDYAIFFQIGDGAIVYAKEGERELREVFWPQHGEYANQTNFIIQENAAEILAYTKFEGRITEIALFSDGLERLILNFSQKLVHTPALQPLFEWLAQPDTTEFSSGPISPLATYLDSDAINSRTDDDKTLIMASRMP